MKRSTRQPDVRVAEKLRWTMAEAAAMCGMCPNYLREIMLKDRFPRRANVLGPDDDEGGKQQFVVSEVIAWADGRDWRALVAARLQIEEQAEPQRRPTGRSRR